MAEKKSNKIRLIVNSLYDNDKNHLYQLDGRSFSVKTNTPVEVEEWMFRCIRDSGDPFSVISKG